MELIRMWVLGALLCLPAAAAIGADNDKTGKMQKTATEDVDKSTGTPGVITRPLTPNTGEYAKTPCYKDERYCPEGNLLPDGKCKLWDVRQVVIACN